MCKSCQLCLGSLWWDCCEERFCWDESIALYPFDGEEDGAGEGEGRGLQNGAASLESLPVTRQPAHLPHNNNHLHLQYLPHEDTHRNVLQEVPILAPNLYQVFSKSMIFMDDTKEKRNIENENNNNKSEEKKSGYYKENIGKVVTFGDSKIEKKEEKGDERDEQTLTDFQIMFQDELYGDHKIFKIEEEEEEEQKSPETPDAGISMKSISEVSTIKLEEKKIHVVEKIPEKTPEKTPDSVHGSTLKSESPMGHSHSKLASSKNLPRAKSALFLQRTDSAKSFTRSNSRQDLLKRVESMKDLEPQNIKNVLARLPERSASFLSVPEYMDGQQPNKSRSDEVFTISSGLDPQRHSLISQMPDTPVIKGMKLPKFFAATPEIGQYKPEKNLQSIVKTPDVIFTEYDFSMPRYYGKHIAGLRPQSTSPSLSTSKSMPDLNEAVRGRVNKRLVKIRSKLKPLVIKKHDGESTKHSHHDLQKF